MRAGDLVVAGVLSGNRNFEGRINPQVKMNYLASPPLVVAYALAGEMDKDLTTEPLGHDRNGAPVYLKDIWPTQDEVLEAIRTAVKPAQFQKAYGEVFDGDEKLAGPQDPEGPDVRVGRSLDVRAQAALLHGHPEDARARHGHHGGALPSRCSATPSRRTTSRPPATSRRTRPAAKYLVEHGVAPADFNSYGARRGNHEVMMRGTFANIRLKNLLIPAARANVTIHFPTGEQMPIYDASMKYQAAKTPLVVLAGAEYGTGSSRDWAAKGTMLLGVKAVIAKSFERIHRSNLVGMGVLPLQFEAGPGRGEPRAVRARRRSRSPASRRTSPRRRSSRSPRRTRKARRRRSRPSAASTPRTRWTTTATAASSTSS